jgi:hypothetical protein
MNGAEGIVRENRWSLFFAHDFGDGNPPRELIDDASRNVTAAAAGATATGLSRSERRLSS